jgi:hypothetical protein
MPRAGYFNSSTFLAPVTYPIQYWIHSKNSTEAAIRELGLLGAPFYPFLGPALLNNEPNIQANEPNIQAPVCHGSR